MKNPKKALMKIRHTPLHPQWFAYAAEGVTKRLLRHCTGTVLDIGCGEQHVRKQLPAGSTYIGLDYYLTATQWYHTRPTLYGDAKALPIREGSIDFAVLTSVLEHLPKPVQAIREIARVLKPGGSLIANIPFVYPVHDAPLDFQRWTRFGIEKLLTEEGLQTEMSQGDGRIFASSALLFNIALAKAVLNGIRRRHLSMVLAILLPLIPILNVTAWLLSRISLPDSMMTSSYTVVCRKPAVAPETFLFPYEATSKPRL